MVLLNLMCPGVARENFDCKASVRIHRAVDELGIVAGKRASIRRAVADEQIIGEYGVKLLRVVKHDRSALLLRAVVGEHRLDG